ncbi:hypothetical protein AAG570_002780 [Ranatra chinensis]|uniref:Protein FRA10AC1 n=1 Tax=Ranatra chinensis TaxID=642074 RepID=A0ABD0Y725_9HEMI
MNIKKQFISSFPIASLNPFELHKRLINNYILVRKGSTSALRRDSSRDKRDIDVIRENHKFLWEGNETPSSWEERLAKKYYDKLFKEYCISDLSRYKENKIAMRWQTEHELVTGKGQFSCGAKQCLIKENLRTWEVNFGYVEHGEKKNALVKLRLCPECSKKLNYRYKRKEVKRNRTKEKTVQMVAATSSDCKSPAHIQELDSEVSEDKKADDESDESKMWKKPLEEVEEVSRENEFEQYLEQLLL